MKTKLINDSHTGTYDRYQRINWWLIVLVAVAGSIIVGSLGFGFYRGTQLYQKYFPLTDASMEMRLEATTAYLWFEEMPGGDKSKNMDEILKHLDQADWYANAMIEGGKSATGMGLYLCRTLADQMGARIEVESEVDKGSLFKLIMNKGAD